MSWHSGLTAVSVSSFAASLVTGASVLPSAMERHGIWLEALGGDICARRSIHMAGTRPLGFKPNYSRTHYESLLARIRYPFRSRFEPLCGVHDLSGAADWDPWNERLQ